MTNYWPEDQPDFDAPWQKARRGDMIARIDFEIDKNKRHYKELRNLYDINWESPKLDTFVGKAFRLQNLRIALQTYPSEKLEEMKKGFEEL